MTDLHEMLAGWAVFLHDDELWVEEISFARLKDANMLAYHPTKGSALGALKRIEKIRAFRIPQSVFGTPLEPMLRSSIAEVTKQAAMPGPLVGHMPGLQLN